MSKKTLFGILTMAAVAFGVLYVSQKTSLLDSILYG